MAIDLLGLQARELEFYQMALRTVIVFVVALVFIRLSGMRTFGTQSAFDVVVSITLGGILSRCITGHYPFYASLGAAGLLVLLHQVVAFLSYRSSIIGRLTAGKSVLLYADGEKEVKKLARYSISDKELLQAMHEENIDSFEKVKYIWLEPDGKISVVKKDA